MVLKNLPPITFFFFMNVLEDMLLKIERVDEEDKTQDNLDPVQEEKGKGNHQNDEG